jgi:uncharacterized Zn-binding protein involved in type VI secretion
VPAVCRGAGRDADVVHCSQPRRMGLSPNVFVNGIGISRQKDMNTPHLRPGSPCPVHTAPIVLGSSTVRINGLGCGRIGDVISSCTSVAEGSSNVFAGD